MSKALKFGGHPIPDDIIDQICIALAPKDFLAFAQTCRYLHSNFSVSDYIWHQITHDLPLDLSHSRSGHLQRLSGTEIKALAIKALKLDFNWRLAKPVSRIGQITKIARQDLVIEMKSLGAEWVAVSQRSATRGHTMDISLWHLPSVAATSKSAASATITPTQVLSLGPTNAYTFEAARQEEGGDIALVSVMGKTSTFLGLSQVTIYKINLRGRQSGGVDTSPGTPYVMKTWKIERSSVFYYSQIHGSVVATASIKLGDFTKGQQHQYQLHFFDTKTEVTFTLDSPVLSMFDVGKMRFKLYSEGAMNYIVMAGVYRAQIKVAVRMLPAQIFSSSSSSNEEQVTFQDFAASIVDYDTSLIQRMDIHLSPEPTYLTPLHTFTILATYSAFSSSGTAKIYRFPIDTRKRNIRVVGLTPLYTISTSLNVTLEPICLGRAGARAVWLSRHWNSDDYTLMKAAFPPLATSGSGINAAEVVVPLQPPDLVLPFQHSTCRSMYFEEASGRLFVGIHTGEVYILHF